MHIIVRNVFVLVGLTLCGSIVGYGQVVRSIGNGLWNDPGIWDSGVIPTSGNAAEIWVEHEVIVPGSTTVDVSNLIIHGRLTVATGAVVNVIADALPDKKDLQVYGILVKEDGAVLNGTSVVNTAFESGARYVHLQGPLGFIPYATWDNNATFEIAGFRTQGYINIAHSDSWKQNFGHVVYNCPQQTTAFVDLNGYLRNIAGNLTIQSTNNQALRLSTTQNPVINIGGDLIVSGASEIWFSTTPSNAIVNIAGNFRYLSTSTGISYFTTKGIVAITVQGDFEMDSGGRIHLASTSLDSTGSRQITLALQKDFTIRSGTINAPPSPGKGKISFVGTGLQVVNISATGTTLQGHLEYSVENNSIVQMGSSVLSNTIGAFLVSGTLQVGSTDPLGAIQLGKGGNIQTNGARVFAPGATVEYNGMAAQWLGDGHPGSPGVNLICNNPFGVTLLSDVTAGNVQVGGRINTQTFTITAEQDITVEANADFSTANIRLTGAVSQVLSAVGKTLMNLTVNKSAGDVTINSPLNIRGTVAINSENTTVISNGQLTLLSVSDDPNGTATVATMPSGSAIVGDVTVQRHMAGEGRVYRFLSSPIQNATVASWQDDFPITGRFMDPSVGTGIVSNSPSLYYYDESIGPLQAGWLPYPTSDLARENALKVGQGYAAFIRRANASTTWDVTGLLNQGTIELPVAYTPEGQPSNGWNLIGNPYASAIEWNFEKPNAWTTENISSVIATYDNTKTDGIYRYWDMDNNYDEIPEGKIALGQSFWVRATGANPELVIHEGAKVLGGATFFRKPAQDIPSFAVHLSRDSLTDVAYFKIRPSSNSALDHWDGLKLDNDDFDISFLSTDQKSLAIQAVPRIPCDTIIPLNVKDIEPGVYKLRISTKHNFSRYDYALLDKFTGDEIPVLADDFVLLEVTDDPASAAVDRFSVRIQERRWQTDIEVETPSEVCVGGQAAYIVKQAKENVIYSLWNNSNLIVSDTSQASVQDLYLQFNANLLAVGNYALELKAQSACQVRQQDLDSVRISPTPRVWADSIWACRGNNATIEAHSNRINTQFVWFEDAVGTDTLFVGNLFETVSLVKSKTFYVQGIFNGSGCNSGRVPVVVNVIDAVDARIDVVGDSWLVSNVEEGNTWLLDDHDVLGEGSSIMLDRPGTYTLVVRSLDCITRDTFEYYPLSIHHEFDGLEVYPNPVKDFLFIQHAQPIDQVVIVNSQGQRMVGIDPAGVDLPIDLRSFPAGIYFVMVGMRDGGMGVKVVKE